MRCTNNNESFHRFCQEHPPHELFNPIFIFKGGKCFKDDIYFDDIVQMGVSEVEVKRTDNNQIVTIFR